ncbi:hypothetical protein V6Z12_A10G002000 [Gossypium hirsutum]
MIETIKGNSELNFICIQCLPPRSYKDQMSWSIAIGLTYKNEPSLQYHHHDICFIILCNYISEQICGSVVSETMKQISYSSNYQNWNNMNYKQTSITWIP